MQYAYIMMCRLPIVVCVLFLGGCDLARCVVNDHPEFSKNSVGEATLNQEYEDVINVSISNSITDFNYDFAWELEGDLPQGIAYEATDDSFRLYGTPTELGDFSFELTAVATSKVTFSNAGVQGESGVLCSNIETRDIALSVVQGF